MPTRPAAVAVPDVDSTPVPTPVSEIRDRNARRLLSSLCAQYRDLSDQTLALETAKKGLMSQIKEVADELPQTRTQGEGWLLARITSVRRRIDPKRLLKKGVSVAVIQFATVATPSTYYKVLGVGAGTGNENEKNEGTEE